MLKILWAAQSVGLKGTLLPLQGHHNPIMGLIFKSEESGASQQCCSLPSKGTSLLLLHAQASDLINIFPDCSAATEPAATGPLLSEALLALTAGACFVFASSFVLESDEQAARC